MFFSLKDKLHLLTERYSLYFYQLIVSSKQVQVMAFRCKILPTRCQDIHSRRSEKPMRCQDKRSRCSEKRSRRSEKPICPFTFQPQKNIYPFLSPLIHFLPPKPLFHVFLV